MKDSYNYGQCVAHGMTVVYPSPGWLLTSIHTPPKFRRRGYTSRVLREVCSDADVEGTTLYLAADDQDPMRGMSFDQLRAWYSRYGFKSYLPADPSAMRRAY